MELQTVSFTMLYHQFTSCLPAHRLKQIGIYTQSFSTNTVRAHEVAHDKNKNHSTSKPLALTWETDNGETTGTVVHQLQTGLLNASTAKH
eukprot:4544332-Pleurochrysis_carterae.AAC.1